MMLKTAMQERNKRLEKMARDAITQYNADMAAGSEPLFPDWTLELLGLISAYDEMVRVLAAHRVQVVDFQDLETRAVRTSIMQRVAS